MTTKPTAAQLRAGWEWTLEQGCLYHGKDFRKDCPMCVIPIILDLLAEAQADSEQLRMIADKLYETLLWCSGSADFAPDGKAYTGWRSGTLPVLAEYSAYDAARAKEKP